MEATTNAQAPLIPSTAAPVATTGVLVNITGAPANMTPPSGPPTLASIAEILASMQLQMSAINTHLADQGARLSAIDGRPPFPQFGLAGYGGVPHSHPVITELMPEDSSASVSQALQMTAPAPQEPRPVPPQPMGVPIHQINLPRSPSPIPGFPSSGMPVYSAPVFFKPRNMLGVSTMPTTALWSSRLGTGCCCACFTDTRSPWFLAPAASFVPSTPDPLRCLNASARSPTACVYQRAPASTTSSMSASSSRSGVLRRHPSRPCLRFTMAVLSNNLNGCCAQSFAAECGISSSSGPVCQLRRPPGSLFRRSVKLTPHSSSRTSCFPRGGEMLW
ncbi:uncharacterized protein [Miscanthus floridulus]|uniref:uncharacterized protein isoform X1 n=1 Tax=Miscanthus floridulus TaxID=154761 RepID=UPI003457668B